MTKRWPRPSAGLALASLIATATLTGTVGFARQNEGQWCPSGTTNRMS